MNLKDIIEYRDRCVICQHQMEIKHLPESSHNLTCFVKDQGFRTRSKSNKGVFYMFGFDGKLTRGKRDFGMGYKTPLHFIKACPHCKPFKSRLATSQSAVSGKNFTLKNRTISTSHYTSISNMKSYGCEYLFDLTCGKDGNYTSILVGEMIRYPSDKAFYHVHTNFIEDKTTINHGLYSGSLDKILTIATLSKKMNHIKNKEELVEKFKLYSLFS